MGPLIAGGARTLEVHPMEFATGVTLTDATPTLGAIFEANLTVNPLSPDMIASTTWTYVVTYNGYTSVVTLPDSSTNTNALFYARIPGVYTITAYTTYEAVNPSVPPHAPTTFTTTASVRPPTRATPTAGFGVNVPIYVGTPVSSDISSVDGSLGAYAIGRTQEWIEGYVDHNDAYHAFQTDGVPPNNQTSTFFFLNGVLHDTVSLGDDMVGGVGVNWANVPNDDVVVTYVQRLRYAWQMTARLPDGSVSVEPFASELHPLDWEMVKIDPTTWMLRRFQQP